MAGGFDSPWGEVCEKKHPVSDLVLTAATIKTVKMLCYTVCTVHTVCIQKCSQDGVGTSPGATINSWGKFKKKVIRLKISALKSI